MKKVTVGTCILAAWLAGNLYAQGGPASTAGAGSWNPKAAAAYLDGRIAWWMTWPSAARDQIGRAHV